jgi:hypothetical protein
MTFATIRIVKLYDAIEAPGTQSPRSDFSCKSIYSDCRLSDQSQESIAGGLTSLIGTLALAASPTVLSNAVSAERQGRVRGNNQALQVGAES